MNSESPRIATQLRNAFAGKAWHGPPLSDLLAEIPAEQARMRPLASAHNIWELVLHIDVWVEVAFNATQGIPMPKLYGTEKDWLDVGDSSTEWAEDTGHMFDSAERLAKAIESFEDSRLQEVVPGCEYDFYYLFHGIVQHSLYHAGQIAMLKRVVAAS